MGTMETMLDRVSLESRRRALERLVQQASERQALNCPHCKQPLNVEEHHRARKVNSTLGLIRLERS